MTRFVVVLVVLLVLWILLQRWLARQGLRRSDRRGGGVPPPPQGGGRLVRCDACGVHIPAARALTDGRGGTYCSSACRQRRADTG